MQDIYDTQNGHKWLYCNNSRLDPCGCSGNTAGIDCDPDTAGGSSWHVTNFQFSANPGFSGTIPSSLARLPQLNHLDIRNNGLTGSIPESLCQLSNTLMYFNVFINSLTGTIPKCFAHLSKLSHLNLADQYGKALVGTIPNLEALTELTYIQLNGNKLTGAVPSLPFAQYTDDCFFNSPGGTGNNFSCPLPPGSDKCIYSDSLADRASSFTAAAASAASAHAHSPRSPQLGAPAVESSPGVTCTPGAPTPEVTPPM
jgi:hypothetical protein